MAIALQPWCSQCGSKEDLTGDHITALANGNRRPTLDGIQVLCRSCNSRKGAR
jgi:5-methylcytosine-specific restriction endonuclease McrA